VCSVGSWIYFVYAGLKRHDRRQFLVAAVYALLFVTFFLVAAAIDPTPVDSRELSTAENIGVFSMLGLAVTASAHGVILAAHSGAARKRRALRDYARQVTFHDPARARELGIGRPDLARTFDDGGLVDVNHVPGHELARLPGLDSQQAHRIVIERHEHGAFARPEDLVIRGLMTPEALHRLGPRLICVPPGAAAPAPQATADRPR
jgi:DNA uptake protein ComE-like DNA-binding protein